MDRCRETYRSLVAPACATTRRMSACLLWLVAAFAIVSGPDDEERLDDELLDLD